MTELPPAVIIKYVVKMRWLADLLRRTGCLSVSRKNLFGGTNMSTTMAKPAEVTRKWYVLDATDKPLGRVAAKAAHILRG